MADAPPAIAVVGMAALFPGAPDLDAFATNLREGVDAITTVPPDRINPVFLDPTVDALDRFYGDRGGFVDPWVRFDPLRHGVVPSAVDAAEPDQLVTLSLATDALRDASRTAADLPTERTGVFLGRGGYITPGLARSAQKVREGEQILAVLRQVLPDLPASDLAKVKEAWRASAGDLPADQAIGLVPNLAASRTANRLDLRGPAFTFDAACASSLVAVEHAVRELRSGRLDAALVGGVHLVHDPTFWSIFCRLGAMSRAGRIRPFDADADGLLIGEGAGMLLLTRLDDAVARGDRVRAVLRGVGSSSDGKGATLLRPGVDGQVTALRRAWADAALDPATVGYVEAHGTATAAGDSAELRTLMAVFGREGAPVGLGSVKSMIGHTMPAAGIAGLIKAVLAVEEGTWLPSLHVDRPHDLLAGSRFEVPASTTPWAEGSHPRRAGVNAFGFGGINAHVVVEQAPERATPRPGLRRAVTPVGLYSATSLDALVAAIEGDRRGRDDGPLRCAVHDPTPGRRAQAAKLVARGRAWHGRKGFWFSPETGGRVAFLCPGVEEAMDEGLPEVADRLGLEVPDALRQPVAALDDLGPRGEQIVRAAPVAAAALAAVGVQPDVVAGHSIGEWGALLLAGAIDPDGIDAFIGSLSGLTLSLPDVVFGVSSAGREAVLEAMQGNDDVVISHDNGPRQLIVCGPRAAVTVVLESAGGIHTILPFQSGFHTEHFAPYAREMAPSIDRVPLGTATVPVWSSSTVAPWPTDPDGIRATLRDVLVQPVRFRETLEALYDEGVRTFVTLGRSSLGGFVADTLAGRRHAAIDLARARMSALDGFAFAAAALWCEGVAVDVDAVPGLRGPGGRVLSLGAPLVGLASPPVLTHAAPASTGSTGELPILPGALGEALAASLEAARRAQHEVADALAKAPAYRGPRTRRTTRRLGVDTHPELMDHCLFGQPDHVEDPLVRYPVVPMTQNVRMMIEEAAALVPEQVVVAIEDVRAWRWLVVEPAVEIAIESTFDGVDRVEVSIPGYAEAVVRLAEDYPIPPAPRRRPMKDVRPLAVPVADIYPERWMFHGPAFQGIVDLGPTGADGIEGAVVSLPTPGATMDNVGQVFGFWGFERLDQDGLGFPARIGRMTFHGPIPEPGARLEVRAWIDGVTPAAYRGAMEVQHRGVVWCTIDGWENRRFETDDVVFPFLRKPGVHGLAEPLGDGVFGVRERWRTAASRELLIRRYLDRTHLARWEQVAPWDRRTWVLRRVAACDAVRAWLWDDGHGPLFPIEVQVDDAPDGGLVVHTPTGRDLRVVVQVGDGVAVAAVAEGEVPTLGPDALALAGRDDDDDTHAVA